MRRLINVLVVVLVFVLAGGLALSALPKVRAAAARTQCQNNLKQIGLALHNSYDTYGTFPPATIPNENLPCGQRLSWLVAAMPFIEQNHIFNNLDREKGWEDEPNLIPKVPNTDPYDDHIIGPPKPVGELKVFRCPADPIVSPVDAAGLTNYVGVSGMGPDAAELSLGYPGVGFFGCERKIKAEDIKDGLANTIAVMETNSKIGPWAAGGFPTTRGLDPSRGHYLGAGGQFGSGHRSCKGWFSPTKTVLTNVVFADGSVHGLTDSVSLEVLEALITIAGGEDVGPVGD
jgi:hypothetical protein